MFQLGKNGDLGDVDFARLRSGVTKKNLGIDENDSNYSQLSSIFDYFDTNKEGDSAGKLDREELNNFFRMLTDLAGDNKLSEKEAGKLKIDGKKIDKTGKSLFGFIHRLMINSNNIAGVIQSKDSELIKYYDGHTEEVFKDGSKIIKRKTKWDGKEAMEEVAKDSNGNEISKIITVNDIVVYDELTVYDEDGNPVLREISENGNAQGRNSHEIKAYDKNTEKWVTRYQEESYLDIENKETIEIREYEEDGTFKYTEIKDNLLRKQSIIINNKSRIIEFDSDGCLKGYFIGKGETSKSIAEKFGTDEELLKRANPNSNFEPMEEIRIPKQVTLDDEAVQDMKTANDVWNEADKVTVTWWDEDTKENWQEDLAIVNADFNKKHGWKIAVDKNGNRYILEGNTVLDENYVCETLAWDVAPKVKCKKAIASCEKDADGNLIVDKYGHVVSKKEEVYVIVLKKNIKGYPGCKIVQDKNGNIYVLNAENELCDIHNVWGYSPKIECTDKNGKKDLYIVVKDGLVKGRKIVQNRYGEQFYVDSNNRICDEEVAKENYIESIKNEPKTAMNVALSIIVQMYNNAREAFEAQLAKDGWTARFGDWVAGVFGSKNTAKQVRNELFEFGELIRELQYYAGNNDYTHFENLFRAIFKKDFNRSNLAKFVENPSQENYTDVFGSNSIMEKVERFNRSQGLVSSVVKGATKIIGTIAAIALAPITGGLSTIAVGAAAAAGVSAVVDVTDRASSRVGLTKEDIAEIAKNSACDAAMVAAGGAVAKVASSVISGTGVVTKVARTTACVAGDISTGAIFEKIQTGDITAAGTVINAGISSIGQVAPYVLGKGIGLMRRMMSQGAIQLPTKLTVPVTVQNPAVENAAAKTARVQAKEAATGGKKEFSQASAAENVNSSSMDKSAWKKEYRNIRRAIRNLKSEIDFENICSDIKAKFKNNAKLAKSLLSKLEERAKKIGLEIKSSMSQAAKSVRETVEEAAAKMSEYGRRSGAHSYASASASPRPHVDIKCTPNSRIKVTSETRIRLGNSVDIDMVDLMPRIRTMKDGDSFIIGRDVHGRNDICIENETVSRQHLRVEKINGEIYITDLSSSNGTILNTTQPDFAAKWKPDLQNRFRNASSNDFDRMLNENYANLRRAQYSYESSVSSNMKQKFLCDENSFYQNKYVVSSGYNQYWIYRMPKRLNGKIPGCTERISLNVKADKDLLKELDRLIETGVYVNKYGKKVRINIPDCYYKTPKTLQAWTQRHDPITMYFGEKVSPELLDAISEITEKYARNSVNGSALMNAVGGKAWIAKECNITQQQAETLYKEALKLNENIANSVAKTLGKPKWICSTGEYAAAKKLIDEYKLYIGEAGHARAQARSNQAQNAGASNRSSRVWQTGKNHYSQEILTAVEYFEKIMGRGIDVTKLNRREQNALCKIFGIKASELQELPNNKVLYKKLILKFHPDRNKDDEVARIITNLLNAIHKK